MSRSPDTMQTCIAKIEYYKALNSINDKELCERAQIVQATYSRKMNRKSNRAFDLYELPRIARVLNVTVADLVTRQGGKP